MKTFLSAALPAGILASALLCTPAAADEMLDLKQMLKQQADVIKQLQQRLEQVEQRQAPAAPEHSAREHKGAEEKAGDGGLAGRLAAVEEKMKGLPGLPAGIKISGMLDTSYTYNFNRPDNYYVGGTRYTDKNRKNGLRIFDSEANSFNVDLFELVVQKEVANAGEAGFRVDLNFGKTAGKLRDSTIGPEESSWAGNTVNDNDFEVQQAYVTWRAPIGNGLDVAFGKFVTMHGSEVIEAPDNYNISRSLLFNYAIPFTHTGVRLHYPVNNLVDLTVGINNGWDNVTDNNNGKSIEAQLGLLFNDKYQLYIKGMYGPEQDDKTGPKRSLVDVVAVLKPIDKLTLLLNYDYGDEQDAFTLNGGLRRANWQGFSAVANYDFTDKFSLSARAEYFSDGDGYRLDGSRPSGIPSLLGKRVEVSEYTLTAHYHFTPNMAVRAELRHDDADMDIFVDNKSVEDKQDTAALEFYYRF